MKEQFVTYEIAVKLAKLGFNEPCWFQFDEDGNLDWCYSEMKIETTEVTIRSGYLAPLWQQAIDWFREKFKHHIEIQSPDYQNENDFYWTIHVVKKIGVFGDGSSDNYYEAREQAILKAIELCQNKKF